MLQVGWTLLSVNGVPVAATDTRLVRRVCKLSASNRAPLVLRFRTNQDDAVPATPPVSATDASLGVVAVVGVTDDNDSLDDAGALWSAVDDTNTDNADSFARDIGDMSDIGANQILFDHDSHAARAADEVAQAALYKDVVGLNATGKNSDESTNAAVSAHDDLLEDDLEVSADVHPTERSSVATSSPDDHPDITPIENLPLPAAILTQEVDNGDYSYFAGECPYCHEHKEDLTEDENGDCACASCWENYDADGDGTLDAQVAVASPHNAAEPTVDAKRASDKILDDTGRQQNTAASMPSEPRAEESFTQPWFHGTSQGKQAGAHVGERRFQMRPREFYPLKTLI